MLGKVAESIVKHVVKYGMFGIYIDKPFERGEGGFTECKEVLNCFGQDNVFEVNCRFHNKALVTTLMFH